MSGREISPAVNATVEEYLRTLPPTAVAFVESIREQKKTGIRPKPSDTLIGSSNILTYQKRCRLLDKVASLVDENLTGRSDMCHQFALLIHKSLNHLGIYSKTVTGKATYSDEYTWDHYWVITKNEVIDANTDTMAENIMVSVGIDPLPYWGAIKKIPNDRRLKKNPQMKVAKDSDVSNIWWPELRSWLKKI